jgi:hypothetical protein
MLEGDIGRHALVVVVVRLASQGRQTGFPRVRKARGGRSGLFGGSYRHDLLAKKLSP